MAGKLLEAELLLWHHFELAMSKVGAEAESAERRAQRHADHTKRLKQLYAQQ